jgi:hypothetical protein
MYTILLNESNELTTSIRERIMQRSKLVDSLHFLVDPTYKGLDMSLFTAVLEYITPVSREYKTEYLVKSDELYKGKLEYKLALDSNLTREAGKIEVQLTFIKVELDADGNPTQRVRKTSPTTITIVPISAWSDIIADSALTALDQRLIQVDAMINAANEMNNYLSETKADNIILNEEDNTIQLSANGIPIGEPVERDGSDVASNSRVYVPNVTEDNMLTFTLQDDPEEEYLEFDIDNSNNWNPTEEATPSNYIWEPMK